MLTIRFEKEQTEILKNAAKIRYQSWQDECVHLEFDGLGVTVESLDGDTVYQHFIPWSMIEYDQQDKTIQFANLRKSDLLELKGPAEISIDIDQYTINNNHQVITRPLPVTKYKRIDPEKPTGNPSRVGQAYFASLKTLATAIDKKMIARPQLWGIIHTGKYVCATDGHRIHAYHHIGWFDRPFIVPDTAVPHLTNIFKKAVGTDVLMDETYVHYYGAKYTDKDNTEFRIVVRKIDFGAFNPESLIKYYDSAFEPIFSIDKPKEWVETLTRAYKAAKDIQNNMITIGTRDNTLIKVEAGAQDQTFGSWLDASVEREYKGHFNARFLRDAIKHVGECNVYEMKSNSLGKPILLKSTDGGRSAIVMPVARRY